MSLVIIAVYSSSVIVTKQLRYEDKAGGKQWPSDPLPVVDSKKKIPQKKKETFSSLRVFYLLILVA